MSNLEAILIPEVVLSPLYGETKAKLSTSASFAKLTLSGASEKLPYLNYIVLTHAKEKLPSQWQSDSVIMYNRYYWFLRFAKKYTELHGKDAGIEQQAFQILENAMADIDWGVIEEINNRVAHE